MGPTELGQVAYGPAWVKPRRLITQALGTARLHTSARGRGRGGEKGGGEGKGGGERKGKGRAEKGEGEGNTKGPKLS